MKKKLAILDDYQGVAMKYADWSRVENACDITVFNDTLHDREALVERLAPFEILCTNRERTPLPEEVIGRLPNLKLITTTGMHNHAIATDFARSRGIFVSGTRSDPDSTAELTWGMIFALMRNICAEDASVRAGGWQVSVGHGLTGRTLGVLGLANIGKQVARVGKLFGMRVIAWSSNLTQEICDEVGAELVDKATLFGQSDVLTVHIRLSERTHHIVGADDLARMKPGAYFVNTSRGPIVDEPALVEILAKGRIAGAALDVYETEPLPRDHPLRSLKNTLLMPHIGYVTDGMYKWYWPQTVEDVEAWLDGAPIRPIRVI